jgi:hypothetical protein
VRNALVVCAILLAVATDAFATLTPCPAPASGTATPVNADGTPTGGAGVPFILCGSPVAPLLFWRDRLLHPDEAGGGGCCGGGGSATGVWSTSGPGSEYPIILLRFFEDDQVPPAMWMLEFTFTDWAHHSEQLHRVGP